MIEICGKKGSIRKNHRYSPTNYEYIYLGIKEATYPYCLECAKNKR